MTDRYEKFANSGVREINGYNAMIDAMDGKDTEKPPKMPQIVIIVDELADLMMVAPGEVEEAIAGWHSLQEQQEFTWSLQHSVRLSMLSQD